MVSNAKDDFPDPETQVNVIIWFFGKTKSIFFRLLVLIHSSTITSDWFGESVVFMFFFVAIGWCDVKNIWVKIQSERLGILYKIASL